MNQENVSPSLDSLEKGALVAQWLEEKQGRDILGLDLRGHSEASEAMLIVTARNVRHAKALADVLMQRLSELSMEMLGMEGYKTGQWVLVDLNDVVVNIFQRDVRGYFNLEGLWAGAEVFYDSRSTEEGAEDGFENEDDT